MKPAARMGGGGKIYGKAAMLKIKAQMPMTARNTKKMDERKIYKLLKNCGENLLLFPGK